MIQSFKSMGVLSRRFTASLAVVAALGFFSAAAYKASAFPQPQKVPTEWELKFRYDEPRRIVVEVPGESVPKAYWYITYTVTNMTDEQRQFLPTFELVTKTGKVVRSDQNLPNAVWEKVKKASGEKLLEHPVKIAGPILTGADQAKDGVAIWEEPEAELGSFIVFVTGLSGESVQLKDDAGTVIEKDGKPIVLFKTLQIEYTVSGDELLAGTDPINKTRMSWVMR